MFFPVRIDSVLKHWPIANWVLMAVTIVIYFFEQQLSGETLLAMTAGGGSPIGLVAHVLLHANFFHLLGNMIFLWAFGNAVCGVVNNFAYTLLYLLFGVLAAAAHVAFEDDPAIGASGAINGVVGLAFALYPSNRVTMFWFILLRAGFLELPFWVLALTWLVFDAWGAFAGGESVAYWAHLGGFFAGLATGLVGLKLGWLTLTAHDHPTLAALLPKRTASATPRGNGKLSWDEPMRLDDDPDAGR